MFSQNPSQRSALGSLVDGRFCAGKDRWSGGICGSSPLCCNSGAFVSWTFWASGKALSELEPLVPLGEVREVERMPC
jgi:hypothetical protein